ncbi:hypothetical protein FPCIR_11659 [Fusarium pseudocircinatum]|uniref:Uncharacterized protein n=1 Tax=Fusarium pseudocircinatum TaxID=56676 RepID=A0A8H5NTL0_9HYPO|nr:hypothetical protein FPCIR_11659 [Fusarium pseudocircinatum]
MLKPRPSTPSSKLPSGTAFIAGTGIAGAAVSTGYLAATNASSSSNTSDAENVHANSSWEDPAGHWDDEFDRLSGDHQQSEPDSSDIDGIHGARSATSSEGEEGSEHVAEDDNMSQPDSLIHYSEVEGDRFRSSDVHMICMNGNFKVTRTRTMSHHTRLWKVVPTSKALKMVRTMSKELNSMIVKRRLSRAERDNQQGDFAPDSYSDVNSYHSAEDEVLSQDEDQEQDNNSSDDGFENESDNGGSDQGSSTDSEQSVQGDAEDDSDSESSQEDSGQGDSEAAEDSDQSGEGDSDHNSDDDDESDAQSSHSSEDSPDDSSEGGDDEITEEEQSDPEFDDSEPESEDVSEPEQVMYSDSEGDYSD